MTGVSDRAYELARQLNVTNVEIIDAYLNLQKAESERDGFVEALGLADKLRLEEKNTQSFKHVPGAITRDVNDVIKQTDAIRHELVEDW